MSGGASRAELRPRFPLSDWIERHPDPPHQLARSGMIGELRSAETTVREAPPATEEELYALVAEELGVAPRRVVLTHGATEGAGLALFALRRILGRRRGTTPSVRVRFPEYPPLLEAAQLAGFRVHRAEAGGGDLLLASRPNNPTGLVGAPAAARAGADGSGRALIDETFRPFTDLPSLLRDGGPGLWVLGTMTKAYGADRVRVGWVVPAEEDASEFARIVGVFQDGLAQSSVDQAVALLRARSSVLGEARRIFERNRRALARRVRGVPPLAAPLWFDRATLGLPGDQLAEAAARAGVLVAPGSLFGDPSGVRVCLTRRAFPKDLEAYLAVREEFVPEAAPGPAGVTAEGVRASGRRGRRAGAGPGRSGAGAGSG